MQILLLLPHLYVGARLLPDLPLGIGGVVGGAALLVASAWLIVRA